jgi:hypothetical protein
MFKWTTIAIACLTMLLTAVGCGGGDKTIDVGNGDKVKVSTDLPDDFPDDFPIYDGADLQGAVEGEQEGILGIVATWTTGDDFEDVKSFYEAAFEGGAWQSAASGNASGTVYWSLEESDGDQVGYVAVTDGDEVTIIATIGDDPSAASGANDDPSASDEPPEDGDSGSGSGSDAGTSDLPDEVDLPDDFPSDRVPLPDDARLVNASSVSANGQQAFSLLLYAQGSIEEIAQSYQDKLEGKGYSQTFETSDASGVYASYSEKSDGSGAVVIFTLGEGDIEGYQTIGLTVTEASS